MVTIKIAAFVGILLLAGLLVQQLAFAPADAVTATASEQMHHKPVIDLDKLGRAFRA